MLAKRIIPCLDVKDGVVVKGVKFRGHEVMGEIVPLARRYAEEGADELVFYDITASSDGRVVDKSWISRVAEAIDIPFCVAGGIRSIEDAGRLLAFGARQDLRQLSCARGSNSHFTSCRAFRRAVRRGRHRLLA